MGSDSYLMLTCIPLIINDVCIFSSACHLYIFLSISSKFLPIFLSCFTEFREFWIYSGYKPFIWHTFYKKPICGFSFYSLRVSFTEALHFDEIWVIIFFSFVDSAFGTYLRNLCLTKAINISCMFSSISFSFIFWTLYI